MNRSDLKIELRRCESLADMVKVVEGVIDTSKPLPPIQKGICVGALIELVEMLPNAKKD